jgi:hypothetical protein
MPTIEVWIALGEDGSAGVADDQDTAKERLMEGSSDDLSGTACRLVQLNVTLSEPRYRDDDDDTDKPVDVTIPDDAGRIVDLD